jgi:hypothetical protein
MIMSKDQVITEIRDLKAGAKGLLTYRKALVHGALHDIKTAINVIFLWNVV